MWLTRYDDLKVKKTPLQNEAAANVANNRSRLFSILKLGGEQAVQLTSQQLDNKILSNQSS